MGTGCGAGVGTVVGTLTGSFLGVVSRWLTFISREASFVLRAAFPKSSLSLNSDRTFSGFIFPNDLVSRLEGS